MLITNKTIIISCAGMGKRLGIGTTKALVNENYTDDSSMLEKLGIPVSIVLGSYTNIKITTKSNIVK